MHHHIRKKRWILILRPNSNNNYLVKDFIFFEPGKTKSCLSFVANRSLADYGFFMRIRLSLPYVRFTWIKVYYHHLLLIENGLFFSQKRQLFYK